MTRRESGVGLQPPVASIEMSRLIQKRLRQKETVTRVFSCPHIFRQIHERVEINKVVSRTIMWKVLVLLRA